MLSKNPAKIDLTILKQYPDSDPLSLIVYTNGVQNSLFTTLKKHGFVQIERLSVILHIHIPAPKIPVKKVNE